MQLSFFVSLFPPPGVGRSGNVRQAPGDGDFAPLSPLSLVPSLWGAKSSHCRRLFSVSQRPGGCIYLLPLPAKACDSVMGSKIFTLPPALWRLPGARRLYLFAPPPPLGLAPSYRGAKSSHCRRRFDASPAVRRRPVAEFICSPLPARPCTFVSGSKIFTLPPAL